MNPNLMPWASSLARRTCNTCIYIYICICIYLSISICIYIYIYISADPLGGLRRVSLFFVIYPPQTLLCVHTSISFSFPSPTPPTWSKKPPQRGVGRVVPFGGGGPCVMFSSLLFCSSLRRKSTNPNWYLVIVCALEMSS